MTFEALLKNICERGRDSARAREKDYKLKGALRGFDIAETAEDAMHLESLLVAQREDDKAAIDQYEANQITIEQYWEQRYCTLQLEYVYEVVNVGLRLKATVSARAVRAYADIVGVRE